MSLKKEIGFEILSLSNMMKHKLDEDVCFKESEKILGLHGWVLAYLYNNRDKDIFQKDIELQSKLRRSSVTAMLVKMENNGLITRESVSFDARLKKIVLTEKACLWQEKIESQVILFENELKKGLSDIEVDILINLLKKVKSNIE